MYYCDCFHICKDLKEGEINEMKTDLRNGSFDLILVNAIGTEEEQFKYPKPPQILNEHLNRACKVWMKDKLTCRMLCNEQAYHDQEDK
jgi:hypothetical protein